MKILVYPFVLIAAIGFALSLAVHVMALAGMRLPGVVWMLHLGVFVVWIPAIVLGNREFKTLNRKGSWEKMLKPCPLWMRQALKLVFAYAIVNFVLFIATTAGDPKPKTAPASVVRGFSGHWMVFYSAAFAILYARVRSPRGTEEGEHQLGNPQYRNRDE